MQRFAEKNLVEWVKRKRRKPLMIRGARQVGKSTLVKLFAEKYNYNLIELNLERHHYLKSEFASMDVRKILKEIEFGLNLGNAESENTILFIDEIQVIPEAIQCLRYFYEEYNHIPVIAAGSLLEFALAKISFSMPVGRIEYLWLGPMTFFEFLTAMKSSHLINYFDNYSLTDIISDNVHQSMIRFLREYFIIGGMPESVLSYSESEQLEDSENILSNIPQTFHDDFAKYAKTHQRNTLGMVFDYISRGAGEKIKYVNISREISSKELEYALELLTMAQVITKVYKSDAEYPLNAGKSIKNYKLYSLDIGILRFLSKIRKLRSTDLMNTLFRNKGTLAEQYICQHLLCFEGLHLKPELHYWFREGNNRNAEIDFLLSFNQMIIPVEVKSGKSGSLKSLHQFCYQKQTPLALRFDMNPPSVQKVEVQVRINNRNEKVVFTMLSIPLYLVEKTESFLQQLQYYR